MARIPRTAFLLFWVSLILAASFLQQGSRAARLFTLDGRQFITHMLAYGALGWLVFWALPNRKETLRKLAMLAGPIVLGVSIEILQPVAGRNFAGADLLANCLGVALAFVGVTLCGLCRGEGVGFWRRRACGKG